MQQLRNINPANNAHLKVGERVMCVHTTKFSNGEMHKRGSVYTVEPDTAAYFSLFTGLDESNDYIRITDVK